MACGHFLSIKQYKSVIFVCKTAGIRHKMYCFSILYFVRSGSKSNTVLCGI